MSAVFIVTPVIVASWPAISAAVAGAAAALGLSVGREVRRRTRVKPVAAESVEVEMENSEVVGNGLADGQEMVLTQGDVRLRVTRDEAGRCRVCVDGEGRSPEELRAIGERFAGRFAQMFVYNKVMSELKQRGFTVLEEDVTEDEGVRIHVRRRVG